MSPTKLFRLSGATLLLGGMLLALANLLFPRGGDEIARYTSSIWVPAQLLNLTGALLILFGLPGMYARQAQRSGVLGLVAFVLAFAAVALDLVASGPANAFILPELAGRDATRSLIANPPPGLGIYLLGGFLLLLVGFVLLGVATVRAGVLPRGAGVLLIVGVLIDFIGGFFLRGLLPIPIGVLLACIGFAWTGYALLTDRVRRGVAVPYPISTPEIS